MPRPAWPLVMRPWLGLRAAIHAVARAHCVRPRQRRRDVIEPPERPGRSPLPRRVAPKEQPIAAAGRSRALNQDRERPPLGVPPLRASLCAAEPRLRRRERGHPNTRGPRVRLPPAYGRTPQDRAGPASGSSGAGHRDWGTFLPRHASRWPFMARGPCLPWAGPHRETRC
ncbi:hypothetical protein NDU88_003096 [Pleurodeles waltl]|uniref:Secreted protein n=1 Tax=Pleurodeles waltl TaxID=8319 RepID=A0AAV7W532_PLEWA|nr:hypothetical protein NDU88_003096 [Pleurodeles waltl]